MARRKRKKRKRGEAERAKPRNPLVPVTRRLGHKTVPAKRREERPLKHRKRLVESED